MTLAIALSLFVIFVLFQLLYLFIPLFSMKRSHYHQVDQATESVTILVPAYNEEKMLMNSLQGILKSDAQALETIIINDGSTDQSLLMLKKELELVQSNGRLNEHLPDPSIRGIYHSKRYPNIHVIDKENGGKAEALNVGIVYARHELIVTLDADCVLQTEAIRTIQHAFSDRRVIAAGGTVHIGQGVRGRSAHFSIPNLIRFQVLQYLTAFFMHKRAQSALGSITVIAGAFGAFRRSVLLEVGGYRCTVGEDMDITLKMQQYVKTMDSKGKLIYVPEAICFTECPETFRDLFNQRVRWQKAFIDCLITYRKNLFVKMRFIPSLFLLLDSFLLGTLNAFFMLYIPFSILFTTVHLMIPLFLLLISFTIACYQSIATLMVSRRYGFSYSFRDYLRFTLFIPIEVCTYRLVSIFFVTYGTILYFFNKQDWHVSRRIGEMHADELIS